MKSPKKYPKHKGWLVVVGMPNIKNWGMKVPNLDHVGELVRYGFDTREEAEKEAELYMNQNKFWFFEVFDNRPEASDWSKISHNNPLSKDFSKELSNDSPINDYVCPYCGNSRCSKTEIKCWRCGGIL